MIIPGICSGIDVGINADCGAGGGGGGGAGAPSPTPESLASWNATYSFAAPDALWSFQELAPGDRSPAEVEGVDPSTYDQIGTNHLVSGTTAPTYQVPGDDSRFRIIPVGAQDLRLSDATAFEADGSSDVSFLFKLQINADTGTSFRALFGKASSTSGYSVVYTPSIDQLRLFFNPTAGGNYFINLPGSGLTGPGENLIGISLHRSAGTPTAYLYTPTQTGSVATPITAVTPNAFRVGTVAGVASGYSPGISWGCGWSNRHLTAADYAEVLAQQ